MAMKQRPFPLIADDDLVITPPKPMALYETDELITNGGGKVQAEQRPLPPTYQEPRVQREVSRPQVRTRAAIVEQVEQESTYLDIAKQEAKKDLRRKRQAIVEAESKVPTKIPDLPASPKKTEEPHGLAKYSENLRQSTYILAEIRPVFKEPDNKATKKPKKNSYDFLKRSQIYNHQENQTKKERQMAQELNLTPDDELE